MATNKYYLSNSFCRKTMQVINIGPQAGKQEEFQKSAADIVFYGGAAGGGKTFALLLEYLRHKDVNRFNAALFRRKLTDSKKQGSIFSEATNLYSPIRPKRNKTELSFVFKNKDGESSMSIAGMENEDDRFDWQGAQICYLGFDELTHFTEIQFWYLVGRNRSLCYVRPYIRATFNPDPNSWVKNIIIWWLDKNGEYADESKSGVIRWFIRPENDLIWFDSKKEADLYILKNALYTQDKNGKKYPLIPTSFTFIPADVYDNKKLLERDPGYLKTLQSLPLVERERQLKGNWKIRIQAGILFKREWFDIIGAIPSDIEGVVRYWDRAGTDPEQQEKRKKKNKGPCNTAGCLMFKTYSGLYIIAHMSVFMKGPRDVRKNIKSTASQDGEEVEIWLEQEPGSAGIADVQDIITILDGYYARPDKPSGSKIQRALPLSAQAEQRNVKMLRGDWNDSTLTEFENFDGSGACMKDRVDAASGAYKKLQSQSKLLEFGETDSYADKLKAKIKEFNKKTEKNASVSARLHMKKQNRHNKKEW